MILPAVAAGVVAGSVITRFVRSSVLEALGQDHVRTAEAKGLPRRQVLRWHVLRNALLPLVTVTGVQLAYLLGRGGRRRDRLLLAGARPARRCRRVQARDYPVLQGAVLLFASVFLVINLVVDLLYTRIDPRIRSMTPGTGLATTPDGWPTRHAPTRDACRPARRAGGRPRRWPRCGHAQR